MVGAGDKLAVGKTQPRSGTRNLSTWTHVAPGMTGRGRGVLSSPLRGGVGGGGVGATLIDEVRRHPHPNPPRKGEGIAREAARDRSSRGAPFAQAPLLPLAGRSWRWGCRRHAHRKRRRHPHPNPPRKGEGIAREAARDRSSRGAPFAQAPLLPLAGRSWRWGCRRHAHRKRRRHPHPNPPRKGEGIAPARPLRTDHPGARHLHRRALLPLAGRSWRRGCERHAYR